MLDQWVIEQLIRELAYYKWQHAGCPDDMTIHFWLEAEKEVLEELQKKEIDDNI